MCAGKLTNTSKQHMGNMKIQMYLFQPSIHFIIFLFINCKHLQRKI